MSNLVCPDCGFQVLVIDNKTLCSICGIGNVIDMIREKIRRRREIGTKYCALWSLIAIVVFILEVVFLSFNYGTFYNNSQEVVPALFIIHMTIMIMGNIHVNMVIRKHYPNLRN